MADGSVHRWSESEILAIRAQLARMASSAPFQQAHRRQRFLQYIVGEALEGRAEALKGYTIGIEVFDKPTSFDPLTDPIVRVEAARLREKLREYYETCGQSDLVRIEMPKGAYTPQIEIRSSRPQALISDSTERPSRRAFLRGPIGIAGVIASALILLLVGWSVSRLLTPPLTPTSQKPSLAVLPFESIGGDPSWRRLADGMTQDITIDLSQSKDLLVIARNSTEIYRGKVTDVRDVGRELGVRYVLQGSIQPSDNRIRITAQLIDTRSGENVWATRYYRPVGDIFEVQANVTDSIAATLTGYQGALAQVERKLIRRKPPNVLMAYEHYLLGVEAKHGGASGGVSKEGLEEAERQFLMALEIDPQLTRAYVGLAYVCEYRLDLGIGAPAENGAKLIEYAHKAIALDPNDAEAQMVLGHAFSYQGLNDQALQQFSKAEALAPSNADVLILIAWFLPQLDQSQRAVALVERALRLNPNYPAWYNQGLRYVYFFGGAYDKAIKFVKLVPNPNPLDFAFLASASAMLDDMPAAKAAAAELHRRDATWNVESYLSDSGLFPEKLAAMFVEAARKANVPACAPAERITGNTTFIHLKVCDEERARNPGNAMAPIAPAGFAPQ